VKPGKKSKEGLVAAKAEIGRQLSDLELLETMSEIASDLKQEITGSFGQQYDDSPPPPRYAFSTYGTMYGQPPSRNNNAPPAQAVTTSSSQSASSEPTSLAPKTEVTTSAPPRESSSSLMKSVNLSLSSSLGNSQSSAPTTNPGSSSPRLVFGSSFSIDNDLDEGNAPTSGKTNNGQKSTSSQQPTLSNTKSVAAATASSSSSETLSVDEATLQKLLREATDDEEDGFV